VNEPASAPLTSVSPRSHAGTPAEADSSGGRRPAATAAAAASLATSCHASNNYLKHWLCRGSVNYAIYMSLIIARINHGRIAELCGISTSFEG